MSLTGPMTQRRSNAKTAYGLMSDIKTYILEEPKRIWMGDWILKGHNVIEAELETEGPVCGTVGCIAGNAVILANVKVSRSIWTEAMELLTAGKGQNIELRDRLGVLFLSTNIEASYGTKKYARIVAGMIEQFQAKHETALRSVRVGK